MISSTLNFKETTLKLEKKPLPYLGSISLENRTKLKNSLNTSIIVVKPN